MQGNSQIAFIIAIFSQILISDLRVTKVYFYNVSKTLAKVYCGSQWSRAIKYCYVEVGLDGISQHLECEVRTLQL